MDYIDTVEVAKMIRADLKRRWPTVKFSVRSSRYSGGSSIDVAWTDGPPSRVVDPIIRAYGGSGFDGMIDLKYSYSHWLLPDGSVKVAGTGGTGGSMGSVPPFENPAPAGARRVHLSVDYVFGRRRVTNEETLTTEAEALIRASCGGIDEHGRFGYQYVSDLARGMVYALDFTTPGDSLDAAFRRVVMREEAA